MAFKGDVVGLILLFAIGSLLLLAWRNDELTLVRPTSPNFVQVTCPPPVQTECYAAKRPRHEIAVVTSAVGKNYREQLLPGFIASFRKYFFPLDHVTFFVFVDEPSHNIDKTNVIQFHVEAEKDWGRASMNRWRYLTSINTTLNHYQYVAWFDVDYEAREYVCDSYLADLWAIPHPQWGAADPPEKLPFEDRAGTACYVPVAERRRYFFGSQYGGRPGEILRLAQYGERLRMQDEARGIQARIVDESATNKWFNTVRWPDKIHDKSYCWPEPFHQFESTMEFTVKRLVHREKRWGRP